MEEVKNITLDVIYKELKAIQKELQMVEYAVIPAEKLPPKELEAHKKNLEKTLISKGKNLSYRGKGSSL